MPWPNSTLNPAFLSKRLCSNSSPEESSSTSWPSSPRTRLLLGTLSSGSSAPGAPSTPWSNSSLNKASTTERPSSSSSAGKDLPDLLAGLRREQGPDLSGTPFSLRPPCPHRPPGRASHEVAIMLNDREGSPSPIQILSSASSKSHALAPLRPPGRRTTRDPNKQGANGKADAAISAYPRPVPTPRAPIRSLPAKRLQHPLWV